MTMLASQITSLTVVYSIVYSGVNQRKHQSSASLAFVREIHRGPVNFPHKWPVTRKMFPFDDVIMWTISIYGIITFRFMIKTTLITYFIICINTALKTTILTPRLIPFNESSVLNANFHYSVVLTSVSNHLPHDWLNTLFRHFWQVQSKRYEIMQKIMVK